MLHHYVGAAQGVCTSGVPKSGSGVVVPKSSLPSSQLQGSGISRSSPLVDSRYIQSLIAKPPMMLNT